MPLGRFIKHTQQYHDKYAVEIHVHRALNVTDGSPSSSFFIKYKRGSAHHGTSLRSTAESTSVTFNHCSFAFPCTLYYNAPLKKDYEAKYLTLSINEDTEKGHKALGEVKINLAEYAKKGIDATGKQFQLTETLVKRKTDPLKLQLTLSLKCIYEGHTTASGDATPDSISSASSSPIATSPIAEHQMATIHRMSNDTETASTSGSANSSGSTTPRDYSSLAISLPDESSVYSTPSPRSQGSPLSSSPTRGFNPTPPVPFFATPPRHIVTPGSMYRQSSDGNLLNTVDITRRLASRHPELCTPGTSPVADKTGSAESAPGLAGRVVERHRRTNSEIPSMRNKAPVIRYKSEPDGVAQSPPDSVLHAKLAAQEQELQQLKQELALRQQQDDERFLIDEMVMFMQPRYSPESIPVSAWVIFRSLLHWRAFHPSNTRLLERLTEAFDRLLARHKSDADVLLYWFSTTASLLYLFRKELQVISVGGNVSPTSESSSVKVFEGQLYSFASLFFKLYCETIQNQLGNVINGMIASTADSNSPDLSCWDATQILDLLESHRSELQKSLPFDSLREQVLRQTMFYIGGKILNAMLDEGNGDGNGATPTPIPSMSRKRVNLCTCAHSLGIKMLTVQIDEFITEKVAWGSAACKKNLGVARQAADVLVVNKETLVQDAVRNDVCSSLTLQQIAHLLESYAPDEFDTEPVHPGVITAIRGLIAKQNDVADYSLVNQSLLAPLLVDLTSGGELETHFTSTSTCDFTTTTIPSSVLARPGFSFLKTACIDNTPW